MFDIIQIIFLIVGMLAYAINERKKKKNAIITPEQLLATYRRSAKVYSILSDIRDQFQAKRICIYQFQNGGKWHSGESVQRMSITHESKYFELKAIKQKNQNILITSDEHPFFEQLLLYKIYHLDSIQNLSQGTYKNKLILRKVKSIYYFLLEDDKTKRPVGMLVLSFQIERGLYDSTHITELKEHARVVSQILIN